MCFQNVTVPHTADIKFSTTEMGVVYSIKIFKAFLNVSLYLIITKRLLLFVKPKKDNKSSFFYICTIKSFLYSQYYIYKMG